jgi:hypothetical protein
MRCFTSNVDFSIICNSSISMFYGSLISIPCPISTSLALPNKVPPSYFVSLIFKTLKLIFTLLFPTPIDCIAMGVSISMCLDVFIKNMHPTSYVLSIWPPLLQPHFGLSVRVKPTLPKVGTWSPSGLLKTQSSSWRAKTPCIGVFLVSLEKVLKCRCLNWPRIGHLDIYSPSYGQKKGQESNWQFDSWPLKVGNRPLLDVRWQCATWRWKTLEESYNFGSNLVPIWTWGEKLWMPKVSGKKAIRM